MLSSSSTVVGIGCPIGCRSCGPARRYQEGQAMPLGIATLLVGFVAAFMLFNTGQVAVNKQRLSDASDSAAYSGLVWQARAMNFQSYTNRAMIANDVSIGQAASLNSWSNYAAVATGNLATAVSWIPVVNGIVEAVAEVMQAVSEIVVPVSEGMVMILNTVNIIIEASQDAMFYSAFIATPDIVKSVADASDKNFNSESLYGIGGLAKNLSDWNSFTSKYEHDNLDSMVERTDLVSDSREAYATDRNWKFVSKFWFYSSPLTRHRLYYEGETRLMMKAAENSDPEWEWVAKDSMSLHTKTIRFKRWRIRRYHEELPLGWATAYAREDDSDSEVLKDCDSFYSKGGDPCNFLGKNPNAEGWADEGSPGIAGTRSDYGPYALDGYDGIREFRSLSEEALEDDDLDPTLRLRAEVSMDIEDVQGSNDWVAEETRFASELAGAADKLSSISIAEVYYRHPKAYRTGNQEVAFQRANGYNPYWDVRLVPVELTERLIALGLRGNLRSSASTPGLAGYPESSTAPSTEIGGNIDTDLPAYASDLASAMGLEDAAVDALTSGIEEFIPGGAEAIADFETVSAIYGDRDEILDSLKEELQTRLEDELRQAAVNILSGMVADYTGVSTEEQQEWIAQAEAVEAEAEAFKEKMEMIEEQVAADFEVALESLVADYETLIEGINGQIADIQAEVQRVRDGAYNEDAVRTAEQNALLRITPLREQKAEALRALRDEVVDSVLESVARHGAEFFPDGIPRQLIEEDVLRLLNIYLSQTDEEREAEPDESVLGWDDEDEEGNTDPPDDDGGNYGGFEN